MIVIATIDELLDKVDSKYTLVHLAARRAREINSYYHSLGEGLGAYTPPLVESSSNKPLSIALEEIAEEKIVVQQADEARRVAEELLGGIEADEGEEGAEIVELDAAEDAAEAADEAAADADDEPAAEVAEESGADAATEVAEEPAADAADEPDAEPAEEPAADAADDPAAEATDEPDAEPDGDEA